MKKFILAIALTALVLAFAIPTLACSNGNTAAQANDNLKLAYAATAQNFSGIWVNGQGKVTVVPDIAMLTLGVESQSTAVAEAQSKAQTAMDAVISALKAAGIKEIDIQTQHYSIQPVYSYSDKSQQQTIIGYKITNIVTAKVRQIAQTGSIIDAVAAAGGDLTRIQSISFTLDDLKTAQDQALKLALADAKSEAQIIATGLGATLGKLVYATTSSYYPTQTYVEARDAVAAPGATTSISAGELTIQATVQAAYSID